ncbi:MAG: hypothetical protein SAJ12_24275 [Jaaginema sp. PMC 1079.18]|nr:hypothetical protein [Jaaginema sp. PMC 1079.18]MEC4867020.1 hypothetical protein [Jaaginema sp. PMC 1078.18]
MSHTSSSFSSRRRRRRHSASSAPSPSRRRRSRRPAAAPQWDAQDERNLARLEELAAEIRAIKAKYE